jgi:hypothetical protein
MHVIYVFYVGRPLPPPFLSPPKVSPSVERLRLIESNAKWHHLAKFTCKWTLRQVFICLKPPPLLGFCLG